MRTMVLAIACLSTAAAAQSPSADPFCENVRQLAKGAEEADPFRSLRDREFEPRLGSAYCFFSAAGGYTCGHSLARPDETRDSYAARIAGCLPGSTRSSEFARSDRQEVVRLGRLRVRVGEHGTERSHVGRSIDIYFDAAGATPAGQRPKGGSES